eukprot:2245066-Prymnesium_polylepis.1
MVLEQPCGVLEQTALQSETVRNHHRPAPRDRGKATNLERTKELHKHIIAHTRGEGERWRGTEAERDSESQRDLGGSEGLDGCSNSSVGGK